MRDRTATRRRRPTRDLRPDPMVDRAASRQRRPRLRLGRQSSAHAWRWTSSRSWTTRRSRPGSAPGEHRPPPRHLLRRPPVRHHRSHRRRPDSVPPSSRQPQPVRPPAPSPRRRRRQSPPRRPCRSGRTCPPPRHRPGPVARSPRAGPPSCSRRLPVCLRSHQASSPSPLAPPRRPPWPRPPCNRLRQPFPPRCLPPHWSRFRSRAGGTSSSASATGRAPRSTPTRSRHSPWQSSPRCSPVVAEVAARVKGTRPRPDAAARTTAPGDRA